MSLLSYVFLFLLFLVGCHGMEKAPKKLLIQLFSDIVFDGWNMKWIFVLSYNHGCWSAFVLYVLFTFHVKYWFQFSEICLTHCSTKPSTKCRWKDTSSLAWRLFWHSSYIALWFRWVSLKFLRQACQLNHLKLVIVTDHHLIRRSHLHQGSCSCDLWAVRWYTSCLDQYTRHGRFTYVEGG